MEANHEKLHVFNVRLCRNQNWNEALALATAPELKNKLIVRREK
jgi:hypothetical protein